MAIGVPGTAYAVEYVRPVHGSPYDAAEYWDDDDEDWEEEDEEDWDEEDEEDWDEDEDEDEEDDWDEDEHWIDDEDDEDQDAHWIDDDEDDEEEDDEDEEDEDEEEEDDEDGEVKKKSFLDFFSTKGGSGKSKKGGAETGSAAGWLERFTKRIFGKHEEMDASDLSPYSFVSEVDFEFSEFEALRDTTSDWYRLMKTFAAGGFVLSIIFSSVKIAFFGPRDRNDVFCGMTAKTLVIIFLFGFATLFATYGEIANSIIATMQ